MFPDIFVTVVMPLVVLLACATTTVPPDRVVRDVGVVDTGGTHRYAGPCQYFEDPHYHTLWVTCTPRCEDVGGQCLRGPRMCPNPKGGACETGWTCCFK